MALIQLTMPSGSVVTQLDANEPQTWTDGIDVWQGNPFCKDTGMILQPDSPALLPDGTFIGACSAFIVQAPQAPDGLAGVIVTQ